MARRPAKSGYTFAALVADYERDSPRGKWLHSYDKARLLRALGHRMVSDLTESHILAYGFSRERASVPPDIINKELRTLVDILVWARDVAKKIEAFPKIQFMREPRELPSHIELRPSLSMRYGSARGLLFEQGDAPATVKPARRPRAERWSDAAVAEHLKQHPIDKLNRDGSRFSDQQRAEAIEREQGIKVSRTTVSRRLRSFRESL